MKKIYYLTFLLLLFINSETKSQNLVNYIDSLYGLNPFLYNGQHNPNNIPSNIKGHLFFADKEYKIGTIKIHNTLYSDLYLNYDIYNQDILLKFINNQNAETVIKLPTTAIEEFTIEDKHFIIKQPDYHIYQIIRKENVSIYYKWDKIIEFKGSNDYKNYSFSKPIRRMFLQINNNLYQYRNRRTFLKCFEPEYQAKIKSFIKENKIRFKKSPDVKLDQLITYCNTLFN